jgi:hypothetical protein
MSYLVSVIELLLSIIREGKWTFVVGNTLFTLFGLVMVPAYFSRLPRRLRHFQSQALAPLAMDRTPLVSPKEQGWAKGGLSIDQSWEPGLLALFITIFSVAVGLLIVWVSYLSPSVYWGWLALLFVPQVSS